MKTPTVLYFVGQIAPTSVPLEVAQFIESTRVELKVIAFYKSLYSEDNIEGALVCVGAKSRYDFPAVCRLYQYIRRAEPDVVHVHHTMSAFWASLFGRLHGAKIVRTEHNNARFRTTGQRVINALSQSLADLTICNSQNTYQSLSPWKKRLLGDRWKVVYNGVDVERIDRASSIPPPFATEKKCKSVTIGSVGRLIDQKNYKRFLQAFSEVMSVSDENIRLVIVGEGKNRPELERTIDRLDITKDVTLTGLVERDKVYAALHAFDIFVMPSLWEGFCNAAVEAMAAGLPLVCADIPTLREVAGPVASYADPNDPSSMARTLSKVLNQGRAEWKRLGKEARTCAIERYSVERTAEEYTQSYVQVVEQASQ